MRFKDLALDERLCGKLLDAGIEHPTDIQQEVIPSLLLQKSLLVCAPTGSGKSLAYLLPIVQLIEENGNKEQSLILVPTRELALQLYSVCEVLCGGLQTTYCTIYGGVEYAPQIEALRGKSNIIIATVGRLLDILGQGVVETPQVDYFVVDEVDQMVDLGFVEQIKQLSGIRKPTAQTLCFTATLTTSAIDVVESIAPGIALVSAENQRQSLERIAQSGYFVEQKMMEHLLIHIIRSDKQQKRIVFCRSRKMADRLVGVLKENGLSAEAIHSERSQKARGYILERFRSGDTEILVATDLIARGIDIDSVTEVINFGLPQDKEQYIHRIGRTARAGRQGRAISLCCPDEQALLGSICKMMKQNIPTTASHPYQSAALTKALMCSSKK